MSRFQFRLQSLFPLMQQRRDEAGAEVAKANEAITRIETQLAQLDVQLTAAREHTQETVHDAQPRVDRMLQHGRFDLQLRAERQTLQETLSQLHQELARRRLRLTEAEAEVKRLERLRETQVRAYHELQSRREQAELDDRAASSYVRVQRVKNSLASSEPIDDEPCLPHTSAGKQPLTHFTDPRSRETLSP